MAFQAQSEHSLDAKNRLSIPSRYRDAFSDGLTLVMDTEPCVMLWPGEGQRSIVERALAGKNPLGSEYKRIQRFFNSNAFPGDLDAAGRVIIPPELREHAGLEKECVVAGVGDHLEIWSKERWRAEQADLAAGIGEVVEGLGDPS